MSDRRAFGREVAPMSEVRTGRLESEILAKKRGRRLRNHRSSQKNEMSSSSDCSPS